MFSDVYPKWHIFGKSPLSAAAGVNMILINVYITTRPASTGMSVLMPPPIQMKQNTCSRYGKFFLLHPLHLFSMLVNFLTSKIALLFIYHKKNVSFISTFACASFRILSPLPQSPSGILEPSYQHMRFLPHLHFSRFIQDV